MCDVALVIACTMCVGHEINWLHWEWLHLTNVTREQKQVSVTAPVHLSEEGCACV